MNKSADEWLTSVKYIGTTIIDPDGWDRDNFEASWKEKITQKEFERRLGNSTIIPERSIDEAAQKGLCPLCGALLKKEGRIKINLEFNIAVFDGVAKDFTPQQMMILNMLVSRMPRVIEHWLFMDHIYGLEVDQPHNKIIDVHIHRIRQKIKDTNYKIRTVWGKGYYLVQERDE